MRRHFSDEVVKFIYRILGKCIVVSQSATMLANQTLDYPRRLWIHSWAITSSAETLKQG